MQQEDILSNLLRIEKAVNIITNIINSNDRHLIKSELEIIKSLSTMTRDFIKEKDSHTK